MATTPAGATEAKIDLAKVEAAAEKAYAAAAETAPAPKAETLKVEAPKVEASKIDAKVAAAAAPKKAAAKSVAVKKTAAKPAAKKIVKPVAAKAPAAKLSAPKVPQFTKLKDTIMTKTKITTEDFTAKVKTAMTDAQDKAKAAFEKTSAYATEYTEFTKGNFDAVVESGKILAAGLQDMGKAYVADAKGMVETVTADVKEVAAIKNPADFFKLQGEIMRRNFDAAVAATSKNSEVMVKLAGDAFAPISTRVSLAVEKVKQAA
jgi:phasin family protein